MFFVDPVVCFLLFYDFLYFLPGTRDSLSSEIRSKTFVHKGVREQKTEVFAILSLDFPHGTRHYKSI